MPTWLIIVLAVLFVLAVGGVIARRRQLEGSEERFRSELRRANHDLAEAAAADRGWDRERLEAAARAFHAQERGSEPSDLLLVEVLDRPGTHEDQAVFRVESDGRRGRLTLGRDHGGEWRLDSLE